MSTEDPDAILANILSLLEDEQFKAARQIALEAAARFPQHSRLQDARRALAGKAKIGSGGPESGIEEELRWLADPPAEARGKWVALSGSEMIGCADTAKDLLGSLRSGSSFPKALVVHID